MSISTVYKLKTNDDTAFLTKSLNKKLNKLDITTICEEFIQAECLPSDLLTFTITIALLVSS